MNHRRIACLMLAAMAIDLERDPSPEDDDGGDTDSWVDNPFEPQPDVERPALPVEDAMDEVETMLCELAGGGSCDGAMIHVTDNIEFLCVKRQGSGFDVYIREEELFVFIGTKDEGEGMQIVPA